MTIDFFSEATKELPFDSEELIEKVVNACLDYVEFPYETLLSVVLTNDEEIRKINKEFRDIDRATDVLSFPAVEYQEAGKFDFIEDCDWLFDPESGELVLGDIMISVDKVFEQAESYGHSLSRELAFLVAHSMLHLFGYDHIIEDERLIMEQKQREIMELVGIDRN